MWATYQLWPAEHKSETIAFMGRTIFPGWGKTPPPFFFFKDTPNFLQGLYPSSFSSLFIFCQEITSLNFVTIRVNSEGPIRDMKASVVYLFSKATSIWSYPPIQADVEFSPHQLLTNFPVNFTVALSCIILILLILYIYKTLQQVVFNTSAILILNRFVILRSSIKANFMFPLPHAKPILFQSSNFSASS